MPGPKQMNAKKTDNLVLCKVLAKTKGVSCLHETTFTANANHTEGSCENCGQRLGAGHRHGRDLHGKLSVFILEGS